MIVNQSSSCYPAQYLAQNLYLNVVLLIRIGLCALGIVLCIVLIKVQGNNLVVHKNALILFTNHHVALILQSGTIVINGLCFILYRVINDPCDLYLSYPTCIAIRFIPAVASNATILSLFTLAIERSWASYRIRHYENANAMLGILLLIIQWVIAFLMTAFFIDTSNMDNTMVYCGLVTSSTSGIASIMTKVLVITELLAISCYFILLIVNKRRRNRMVMASLSEKYQVNENIRAIQLLIPAILTHAIFFIPPLCFYAVYLMISTNPNSLDYPLIAESTAWAPFYSAALPLVLFWRNQALRTALRRKLSLNVTHAYELNDQSKVNQNAHFTALTNMWDEALGQTRTAKGTNFTLKTHPI